MTNVEVFADPLAFILHHKRSDVFICVRWFGLKTRRRYSGTLEDEIMTLIATLAWPALALLSGFQGPCEDAAPRFTTRHFFPFFFYHSYLNCRRAQQLIEPKNKENQPRPLSVEDTSIKPGPCNLPLSPRKAGGHAAKEAHFPAEAAKHLCRFNVPPPALSTALIKH